MKIISNKKTVKRRSNWYIYLLTFIISFAALSFVVWNMRDLIFPVSTVPVVSSSGRIDYRPDASYNTNVLFMLSEIKGGVPDYYMLANYRPRDEVVVLVPVKANLYSVVGNVKGSLSEIYKTGGASGVIYALNNALDIEFNNYIKFDKSSFMDFIDLIGRVPVNIPYTLKHEELVFTAGSEDLTGERLYSYLTFPEFNEGEDYRCVVHGSAISNFINNNSRNLTVTQLQSFFNKILNTTDTNFEFADFTKNQQAYLYNTQNSYNMAEYYIPYGETNESGYFIISDSSKAAIKDRFGLNG